jgi:hypothetical protein
MTLSVCIGDEVLSSLGWTSYNNAESGEEEGRWWRRRELNVWHILSAFESVED